VQILVYCFAKAHGVEISLQADKNIMEMGNELLS
jgi:hypothetical protein